MDLRTQIRSGVSGGMAEPVDAADLKSAGRKAVGVQVPLPPWLKALR
jgi:hypothetical protein